VAAGMGIAIVPGDTVSLESKAGLVKLSHLIPRTYRRFAMVFHKRENLTPAVEAFMHYIRSYSEEMPHDRLHRMVLALDDTRDAEHL